MSFEENSLLDQNGKLTKDSIQKLKDNADMLECQCPSKLIEIIELINNYEAYTDDCILKYPNDKTTHEWLKYSAININKLLSSTLLQLARLEGFLTDNNTIKKRR
ncbi:hypothetical protein QEJ31_00665 [Pigmentibacter sp. JX0631]|uniref:hypothetical protein n=1 Tax=Pigmentibacter sp. JX0631 TaxID=2976982 RepID=UPI00246949A6|nr:hypothetical protein [Pigmentibacter sp. JX0631]WGL60114.1 hypothetical protein QEJ31_00665 [Pigmentibacter sp. JX0631]